MLFKLILFFTIIPIIELIILIHLGKSIGLWPTILIVFLTGIIGAILSRSQGIIILTRIKKDLIEGRLPTYELINGLCVLVGGATLLTPGLLTDAAGFILIVPATRQRIIDWCRNILKGMIEKGTVNYFYKID